MKKKFSKIVGVAIALSLALSLVSAVPALAQPECGDFDILPDPGDGPISGELELVLDYDGSEYPLRMEIEVCLDTLYGDYPGVLGQWDGDEPPGDHPFWCPAILDADFNANPDPTVCPWDSSQTWTDAEREEARQLGILLDECSYDPVEMEWTIVIDTTKKCEVGDEVLLAAGWMPGQEVWFDGIYNLGFEFWYDADGESPWVEVAMDPQCHSENIYILDNEETITPSLGLNAKGAQQKFWVNYIDIVDGEIETGTATGGAVDQVTDSGASWTDDALIGMLLLVYDVSGTAWLGPEVISDNTGTSVTATGLGGTPADGDPYYICTAPGPWAWAFDPGVNLTTWGPPASPADVKVMAGGRPYTDSYGTCHPASYENVNGGLCLPDRYIEIQARAPLLGDCEVEVWTCTFAADPGEMADCCPVDMIKQVASAEKKWGELNYSKLDVHIEDLPEDLMDFLDLTWQEKKEIVEEDLEDWDEDTDHEVWVDSGTCEDTYGDAAAPEVTEDCMVYDLMAEQVWAEYLQVPEVKPAGGAVVHWWLAIDDEDGDNQEWIHDYMDDIVDRAGSEGFYGHMPGDDDNDDWSATGKYDPDAHPVDKIMDWVDGTLDGVERFAVETELLSFVPFEFWDPYLYKDTDMGEVGVIEETWYGRSLTMDRYPGEIPGVSMASIGNYAAEDVLVITVVEYQQDYNGENLILIEIGKKHFRKPPPPAEVKTPQLRWAGEKIVLEKDWSDVLPPCFDGLPAGENNDCEYIAAYHLESQSVGELSESGDYWDIEKDAGDIWVRVNPDHPVSSAILQSEVAGEADVNAMLYKAAPSTIWGEPDTWELGWEPIAEIGFVVYFLEFEDVVLADTDAGALIDVTTLDSLTKSLPGPGKDTDVAVQVRGFFPHELSHLLATTRVDKPIDLNGDGVDDKVLPAGRYVLPDDWWLLAETQDVSLRPNFDLMDEANLDDIIADFELGPFDGGVKSALGEAEEPNIGPFNTVQQWSVDDEWITEASTVPTSHPMWDFRNTVVPDGQDLNWLDAPMPQALVTFDIVGQNLVDEDPSLCGQQLPDVDGYPGLDKGKLEGYGYTCAVSGTASVDGTTTTLDDTTMSWTADEHIDKQVAVVINGVSYERDIVDNTATKLTFAPALPSAVDEDDAYCIKQYESPFYMVEIPSHWRIPSNGYNWDSWGTGMPYDYWIDLALDSICSDTSETMDPDDPDYDEAIQDVEVYSDNHGIAAMTINAPDQTGSITITATAEFPYCPKKGKYGPRVSDEITARWGAKVLNPHFVADKTTVDVDETVTFSNATTGGTHPYTDAWWDFGDDTAVLHLSGTEAVVMQDVPHAYTETGIYTVTLTMRDIVDEERTEFKDDYITVGVPECDPWVYDVNEDDVISKAEALAAVADYFGGEITKACALEVIALYFA